MNKDANMKERWNEFRPTKTLWLWSSVGVVVATMVVGFGFGGWVTGGTAQEVADDAARDGRAELVASVCVERFVNDEGFAGSLRELKGTNSWKRDDYIDDGNWAMLAGVEEPVRGAAALCAERLADMERPAEPTAETADSSDDAAG